MFHPKLTESDEFTQVKLKDFLSADLPFDLEIGFGKGNFLLQKAITYPFVNFLGLEIRKKWVEIVKKKIQEKKLNNVISEMAYADLYVPEFIPANSFRNIYINFPDPWWKRRHKKRRILQKEFLISFYNSLKLNGRIYIRTDVKEYAEFVQSIFSEVDSFVQVEHDIISDNVLSNREIRCKEEGLDIYYLAYQKIK